MTTFANKILLLSLALLISVGCAKQPETIVIEDSPESPATQPKQDTVKTTTESAEFKQLIIGEIHPITTLDPLFADNNSAKRVMQVLYEGLVRYDEKGNIVPAMAKQWRITPDSLTYLFTLRDDLYYHDNNIFSSGLGRKVVAGDIKYAFERMAQNNVPAEAAKLFMTIEGFAPYFSEQHDLLNPVYRELDGVNGIRVPNDTTVAFQLMEQDPHFLQKMASPYASIYPPEAVKKDPQNFVPVGSGPFKFSQQVGDSVYVFSNNQEYRGAKNTKPVLDRIDIIVETNESNMLKSLGAGNIHLIPEVGPQIVKNILTAGGELSPGYAPNYNLVIPGGATKYGLAYYQQSTVPEQSIRSLFAGVDPAQIRQNLPNNIIDITVYPDTAVSSPGATDLPSTLLSTYSEDPYQRWFLQQLSNQWMGQPNLQILNLRIPCCQTALYTRSFVPFYPGQAVPSDQNTLMRYSVKQSVLSIKGIDDLYFNRYPWWINVRSVDMPGIDQL